MVEIIIKILILGITENILRAKNRLFSTLESSTVLIIPSYLSSGQPANVASRARLLADVR